MFLVPGGETSKCSVEAFAGDRVRRNVVLRHLQEIGTCDGEKRLVPGGETQRSKAARVRTVSEP